MPETWNLRRRLTLSGGEIAYDVLGDGPPLILVHGTPSRSYIWRDVDHMMKVVRGPIGEELNQDMIAKTGIRVLDMGWFFGARHIATKDFAVSKPADLKGRKIRMQPTSIYVDAMTAMGANGT